MFKLTSKRWYKTTASLLVFVLLVGLFGYVSFRYDVDKTEASDVVVTLTSTAATTWVVPDDWDSGANSIAVIGGGGGGFTSATAGGGGGGGAFSRSFNVSLTPGATVGINIGDGGTAGNAGEDSWLCNANSNCASIGGSAVVVGAKGGGAGSASAGTGGASGSGIGSDKCSGGNGGAPNSGYGGGGGAGGPTGDSSCGTGANGGSGAADVGGGGGGHGGGSTGGNATAGTHGGNGGNNYLGAGGGSGVAKAGDAGTAGGGGGGGGTEVNAGGAGGAGEEWGSSGSGGGGGGGGTADGNNGGGGGNYGGGGGSGKIGGAGAQGIIYITYTPADITPPTPDPMTFATAPYNASDTSISMIASTATDASSTPVAYLFTYTAATCGANAGTGGTNSAWQAETSYTDTGLEPNHCYGYTVTARDAETNETDPSSASVTYTSAATPGAITFSNVSSSSFDIMNAENGNPSSNPTTNFAVQISATSPNDATWNNQYVDGSGNPSGSAVWLTDAQIDGLTVNNLNEDTEYTVRVKARNQDNDETAWSSTAATTTVDVDNEAPTPNPPYFSTSPAPDSASAVSMTSVTATDVNTIEYFFDAVTGSCGVNLGTGGTDSAWQAGTSYTDSGLEPNHCYAYQITTRDSEGNSSTPSTASSTYTQANTPGAPVITNTSTSTITFTNTENGNPSSNPTTAYAIRVVNTSPADAVWEGKYVDTDGTPSDTAVWQTDAQWDGTTLTDLNQATSYSLQSRARNENNVETSWSSSGETTTDAPPQNPVHIRLLPGIRLQNGVNLN